MFEVMRKTNTRLPLVTVSQTISEADENQFKVEGFLSLLYYHFLILKVKKNSFSLQNIPIDVD